MIVKCAVMLSVILFISSIGSPLVGFPRQSDTNSTLDSDLDIISNEHIKQNGLIFDYEIISDVNKNVLAQDLKQILETTDGLTSEHDVIILFTGESKEQKSTILNIYNISPKYHFKVLNAVSANRIKPFIDSVWPLENIKEAMSKMERGEQFGKIVINIS